ncbi:MAG: hypothetical protein AAF253_13070 [Pseudomonadota bacterium]
MLFWIAAGFALIAALLLLVWPLVAVAPGQRREALQAPAARAMIGAAGTVAIGAMLVPLVAAALISGTDTVQFVAYEFGSLSFGM